MDPDAIARAIMAFVRNEVRTGEDHESEGKYAHSLCAAISAIVDDGRKQDARIAALETRMASEGGAMSGRISEMEHRIDILHRAGLDTYDELTARIGILERRISAMAVRVGAPLLPPVIETRATGAPAPDSEPLFIERRIDTPIHIAQLTPTRPGEIVAVIMSDLAEPAPHTPVVVRYDDYERIKAHMGDA